LSERQTFGLNARDELKVSKNGTELRRFVQQNNKWDQKVLKIDQVHDGLPVEAGQMAIHYDASGMVWLLHGKIARDLPSGSASITESDALRIALSQVNSTKYAWQDEEQVRGIKLDSKNPSASNYPKGQLMFLRLKPIDDFRATNFRLAYRFEIKSLEPVRKMEEVAIDANTGEVLRKLDLTHHAWGTAYTLYNGARGFNTRYRGWPNDDFVLKDKETGEKIHTLRSPWHWWSQEVQDDDNHWFGAAPTSHWAVQVAWNLFSDTYSRNGMDNAGGKIRVAAEDDEINAGYHRDGGYDYLTFGRTFTGGNGTLTPIDVVGHEFAHGVTRHEAALIYQGESGALNESFSDIFGVMVERYLEGGVSWVLGEDANFRMCSLENPNLTFPETDGTNGFQQIQWPSPDTFQGTNWINPANAWDLGGVHHNSGVQNFWFFLLANGGTGTNDNWQAYNVQGIGLDAAARIAYENLRTFLLSGATFNDARAGAINAARNLYGECSLQFVSTMNAWRAVGVGAAAPVICASQIVPSFVEFSIENGWFSHSFSFNVFPAGATVTWFAPWNFDHWTSGTTFFLTTVNSPTPGDFVIQAQITWADQTEWRATTVRLAECACPPGQACQQLMAGPPPQSGFETETESILAVSPNPAVSHFDLAIALPRKEENVLAIVDIQGRTLVRRRFSESLPVDVDGLPNGVYLVVVTNSYGRWTKKLVVAH
jgi:bacillolysin